MLGSVPVDYWAWKRHVLIHILRGYGWWLKEIGFIFQRDTSSLEHHLQNRCKCRRYWEQHPELH